MEPLRWKCRKRRGRLTHCPINCHENEEKRRAGKWFYGSHEDTVEAKEEELCDVTNRLDRAVREYLGSCQ